MTSLHNIWLSKLHISWNLIEGISLPNFISVGCLDQILQGLVKTYRLTRSQKAQSL